MSPTRIAAVALLVAAAGCAGLTAPDGTEKTEPATDSTTQPPTEQQTTEPHTADGTSHAGDHLNVRASAGADNVTVTLAPDGDSETHEVPAGRAVEFTREIHDRGHDVYVVVERGDEIVFDERVTEYESYELLVYENDTDVSMTVV